MSTVTLTGDDYRYRFEVDAKQRFIDSLRERFNARVTYKGRVLKWDTVVEENANRLGRFLTEKHMSLSLLDPIPKLERQDDRELRTKILALTSFQAKRLGIEKSTLHYLRKSIRIERPFRMHRSTRKKLADLGARS
ncbi:MAG: hypothetical protein ACHQ03_10370 [Candidatus Bathyarchaeia archaeon]